MRRRLDDPSWPILLGMAVGFALVATLLTGCGSSTPTGPSANVNGNGNCVIQGSGSAGGDQNGNQGNGGLGTACQPVGGPILSPVPVVAVEAPRS